MANPLATILAAAMLLRHSLKLEEPAKLIEAAVQSVLASGLRTKDIAGGGSFVNTAEAGAAVVAAL